MIAELATFTLASALLASSVYGATYQFQKRASDAAEFFDPATGGGSMFVDTLNGLGEPLNVCRTNAALFAQDLP